LNIGGLGQWMLGFQLSLPDTRPGVFGLTPISRAAVYRNGSTLVAIETFRLQLTGYDAPNEQRSALEARAHALLKDRRDYQHLCEISGIKAIFALVIPA
jgi:hypothetical protein